MIRFLTNIPPPVHLLLLVLIPLLRIPGFDGDFLLQEESFYFLLGQSIIGEPQLYADAWFTGPPIMIWIYSFFYALFGDSALFAIRIFSCFYLYLTAVYFNGMLADYKLFRKNVNLTSITFVFLVSVPWYGQEFSASLFVLLPIIFGFHSLLQLGENRRKNYRTMFQVGVWMMIAILASYKVIFILLGLIFAYIFLKNAKLDEFTALLGGMFTVLGTMILIFYLSGILSEWWDIGLVSYLDRIMLRGGTEVNARVGAFSVLGAWFAFWSVLLILSVIGFLHFRVRFYSYVTKIRSIEMIMAVWLVGILFALAFKFNRLDMSDFVLLVPPIVFYSAKTFDFKWVYKFRYVLLISVLIFPIYSYMSYLGLRFPETLDFFKPEPHQYALHGNQYEILERKDPIYKLKNTGEDKEIWIMEFNPQLYVALGYPCANRYTDYRIAYFKVPMLPGGSDKIFSRKETDKDVYQQFRKNPPDMIFDRKGKFSKLQARYPQVLSKYDSLVVGDYTIYQIKSPKGGPTAILDK